MFIGWFNPAQWPGQSAQAPKLELISREPKRDCRHAPLLFVHGAFAGAWCWVPHFLDYFAAQGFSAHAVSLRGHGGSEGHDNLQTASIADYVSDLVLTVERFPRPPVLIGHSMGGFVVQKYLEEHECAGAVLMASVPPTGLGVPAARLLFGDPWMLTQLSLMQGPSSMVADFKAAKRAIFSDHVSDQEARHYARYFQPESQRAIWDMTFGDLPRYWCIEAPPLLVLGAEEDALFSPDMVKATAKAYGVGASILPNMAHAMMLERHWRTAADAILDWLRAERF